LYIKFIIYIKYLRNIYKIIFVLLITQMAIFILTKSSQKASSVFNSVSNVSKTILKRSDSISSFFLKTHIIC